MNANLLNSSVPHKSCIRRTTLIAGAILNRVHRGVGVCMTQGVVEGYNFLGVDCAVWYCGKACQSNDYEVAVFSCNCYSWQFSWLWKLF